LKNHELYVAISHSNWDSRLTLTALRFCASDTSWSPKRLNCAWIRYILGFDKIKTLTLIFGRFFQYNTVGSTSNIKAAS